jgi:hypothetical protein
MKSLLITLIITFGTALTTMAGNIEEAPIRPKSVQDAKSTSKLRLLVTNVNQQLAKESRNLRLFAQLADKDKSETEGYLVPSTKIVRVSDAKSWPELTVTSYIALTHDDGTVAAFQEVPVSESGDWFNTYTHYYDKQGNTIAFRRFSSFFNGCPDSPANETSTYYYENHRLIAKDYSLKGDKNKVIKADKCDFMYRYDYHIRKNWIDSMKASGIDKAW